MASETPKRGPGRPKGSGAGETPIRHARIGAPWDRAEELALARAKRDGKVIRRKDRATGEVREFGNVTAYVEEALRRYNTRVERELAQEPGE